MLGKTSKISSIDNSGSFTNKILQVYGTYFASAGSLLLVLPSRASFRKRIRRSKFYRAVCVQVKSFVFRKTGFYIRSWLNACVLLKPKERLCTPVANRVSGFLFAELRFRRYTRLLSLTVYILLNFLFMRFVPFRFNSLSYQTLHSHFFIYDFSIKFNLYRFSDLPRFENIFAAVLLPHQASKIACFSIFSELLLYQFQVGNSLGARSSKTHNLIFFTKHLDFSKFISYLRFVLIFPDTRNLLTKPYSSAPNTFMFRIKDFPTLYNFFDFRLDYAKFFPTFHFFSKSSSSFVSSGSQDYMLSFFSAYLYKNTTLFS